MTNPGYNQQVLEGPRRSVQFAHKWRGHCSSAPRKDRADDPGDILRPKGRSTPGFVLKPCAKSVSRYERSLPLIKQGVHEALEARRTITKPTLSKGARLPCCHPKSAVLDSEHGRNSGIMTTAPDIKPCERLTLPPNAQPEKRPPSQSRPDGSDCGPEGFIQRSARIDPDGCTSGRRGRAL